MQQFSCSEPCRAEDAYVVHNLRRSRHDQVRNDLARCRCMHHSVPAEATSSVEAWQFLKLSDDAVMVR